MRIDPQRVVVDVLEAAPDGPEILTAVLGHAHDGIEAVDAVRVVGIDDDLLIVLRAGREIVVHLLPVGARVGAAEKPALVVNGLDDRVNGIGTFGRDRQADTSHVRARQSCRQFFPRHSAVPALVDARAGSAVDQRPDVASALVGCGVQHVGVTGIHDDIDHAGVLVDLEHPVPGLATVDALVQTAVPARSPQWPHGRHEDDLPVLGMDDDLTDVQRPFQTDVLPALASVHRLVDPVAVGDATLAVVLATADPDDVGIGRIDGETADGIAALVVEDRLPGCAGVVRFPHPTGAGRDVPVIRVTRIDGDIAHATRHQRRADGTKFQTGERIGTPRGVVVLVLVLVFGPRVG